MFYGKMSLKYNSHFAHEISQSPAQVLIYESLNFILCKEMIINDLGICSQSISIHATN